MVKNLASMRQQKMFLEVVIMRKYEIHDNENIAGS